MTDHSIKHQWFFTSLLRAGMHTACKYLFSRFVGLPGGVISLHF